MSVSHYILQIAKDSGFTVDFQEINVGNVLTYEVTGLDPGTPYFSKLKAVDFAGNASAFCSAIERDTVALPFQLFIFGDSRSEGGGTISADERWGGILRETYHANQPNHDWTTYHPTLDPDRLNYMPMIAVSGATIPDQLDEIDDNVTPHVDLDAYRCNAAIIMCGINDIGAHGATLVDLQDGLNEWVTRMQGLGVGPLCVSTIPPSHNINGSPAVLTVFNDYNAWINTAPWGSDVTIIDAAARPNQSDPDDLTYFQADGLHENEAGQADLAVAYDAFVSTL